ncbi:MAG: Lrp/AsnC family transcriptional regulator [Desulfopila sp.]
MIDGISMDILKILQDKARIPNVEVSRQVGLAPSAVLERIRKMEKSGIIDGYEVRLNPERFSRSQISFIHITTALPGPDQATIGERLAAIPAVQEVHFIAGEDGFIVKARTADTAELGELLRSQICTIEGVLSTRTTTVLRSYKETAKIPII